MRFSTQFSGDDQILFLLSKKLLGHDYIGKSYKALSLTDQAKVNHIFSYEYFENPGEVRNFFSNIEINDIPPNMA